MSDRGRLVAQFVVFDVGDLPVGGDGSLGVALRIEDRLGTGDDRSFVSDDRDSVLDLDDDVLELLGLVDSTGRIVQAASGSRRRASLTLGDGAWQEELAGTECDSAERVVDGAAGEPEVGAVFVLVQAVP